MGIRSRCLCSGNTNYHNYGGRGIKICDDWLIYENFEKWALSSGYRSDLTIEREDVNGNYCPSNCKWIPAKEQLSNRRNSLSPEMLSIQIPDGMSKHGVYNRIRRGWSLEEASSLPKNTKIRYARKIKLA